MMPRRLLGDPHLLAHELRTPLSILAGWYSLVRDGDISPTGTPAQWQCAMETCQRAVDRLNYVIKQACDEDVPIAWRDPSAQERVNELIDDTRLEVDHSREVLSRVKARLHVSD